LVAAAGNGGPPTAGWVTQGYNSPGVSLAIEVRSGQRRKQWTFP